ncbi:hypothetical protein NLG97_g3981 [Lecanicillium saksenae]|uniref:Uncharacterized protein n=1 Tax=Lecanicillium saksenae TaxID=468837 RepID=A0ACC1QYA0_9HYPO|nr:hypothetical protein NLG97_g3981 [Lecanicillium saksenae]
MTKCAASNTAAPDTRRIDSLTEHHRHALLRGIENVCNTNDARMTFAQILDGVPTIPLLDGGCPMIWLPESHPSWTQHRQLCPGALDRLDHFREQFNAGSIHWTPRLCLHTRAQRLGRDLEITLLDENFHKEDGMNAFIPPESDTEFWGSLPKGPPPTWLYLQWYQNFEQYPQGYNDVVGYWAENYIIGGVLLFDRREESSTQDFEMGGLVDPDGVFLHAERIRSTYRICKLLEIQKKAYLDFLQASGDEAPDICPLPLMSDKRSFDRVDPEDPILETGIYRDDWERLPVPYEEPDERLRDVMTMDDYPRYLDWFQAQKRAAKRRDRIEREQSGRPD